MTTALSIVTIIIFAGLLYSIFKTRSYKQPKQIMAAIVGALILVYLLYTCNSDN